MGVTTMSDVARAAGVSVMTVSNVINGRPRVGPDTRLRVLNLIDELGYQVNLTARSLRAGQTNTIALIVPAFDHAYFGELAARVSKAVEATGRHLALEQTGASPDAELAAVSIARLQTYDGVLLSVVGLDTAEVDLLHPNVPIVLLGERLLPERFDHVSMGNVDGARLATQHLLTTGSGRVAVLGGTHEQGLSGMTQMRTAGWRTAHQDLGREPDPALIIEVGSQDMREARDATAAFIASGVPFDRIFASTDAVAIGARSALATAGLRVPQDVQVIGFDNLPIGEFITPSLSCVDPGHDFMVAEAMRLLTRNIANHGLPSDEPRPAPEHVIGPARLILRGSTRT